MSFLSNHTCEMNVKKLALSLISPFLEATFSHIIVTAFSGPEWDRFDWNAKFKFGAYRLGVFLPGRTIPQGNRDECRKTKQKRWFRQWKPSCHKRLSFCFQKNPDKNSLHPHAISPQKRSRLKLQFFALPESWHDNNNSQNGRRTWVVSTTTTLPPPKKRKRYVFVTRYKLWFPLFLPLESPHSFFLAAENIHVSSEKSICFPHLMK